MATARAALTDEDLRMLVKGPNDDERALAAHKLCRAIDRQHLTGEELARAQEILRLMARDAAEMVRRALAVTLKASPVLPRDVAMKLAKDLETIAIPVLNFSPAFTEEDLIDVARRGGPVRQVAIAQRRFLSEAVAGVLVEVGCEEAVRVACANDNIALGEGLLTSAIGRFEKSQPVLSAIAYRNVLPLSVSEKLITLVSDVVRNHLIVHHHVPADVARQLSIGARERATVDLVDQAGKAPDMAAFVTHLHRNGRLTASLLVRALAQGQMNLFEWGISELSGVPHHRTWLMIHDAGSLGLKAIYERAGLPSRLYPAFRSGVDTYHAMNADGGPGGPGEQDRFRERMMQRFLTQPHPIQRDDADYLLDRMDRLAGKPIVAQRAG
jgi:uncharacterized protein (DUF2336 family)